MKRAIILLLLIIPFAAAQLDWDITDLRCGNEKLDTFEMCEADVDETYCDDLGELLKIGTACDEAHCTCVPRVNKAFCGNGRQEGVEVCDGDTDFCPELGQKMGLELTCNKDTCGCDIVGEVPDSYNPDYIEYLENLTQQEAVCGNKQLEGTEECDPEGVLCTTVANEAGTCSSNCTCVVKEIVGEANETETTEENETVEPVEEPETEESEEEQEEAKEEKEPGFFGKLWGWFVSLFQ